MDALTKRVAARLVGYEPGDRVKLTGELKITCGGESWFMDAGLAGSVVERGAEPDQWDVRFDGHPELSTVYTSWIEPV